MREHLEKWLKMGCLVLAALVLLQIGSAFLGSNPLAQVRVPSPPTLPPDTNSVVAAKRSNTPGLTAGKGTNTAGRTALKPETNLVSHTRTNANPALEKQGTNLVSGQISTNAETNVASNPALGSMVTNLAPALEATNSTTNILAGRQDEPGTNPSSSNMISVAMDKRGTNKVALAVSPKGETNSASPPRANHNVPPGMPPEFAAMMGMNPMGAKLPELPAATKAIIDRITESEILAPIIRPQPMALLGIAGDVAFLRAASGQTGIIKTNETLGELKLLRIGINRVLVEQDGQKKELMIFSGYGGESLLPKTDTPNETTN
jgi:hypothetical protein